MKTLSVWKLASVAPLAAACSIGSGGSGPPTLTTASSDWTCFQAAVPNGTAVECTAAATTAPPTSYTCGSGERFCPPGEIDAGTPPVCESNADCVFGDGGPVGQGGSSVGSSDAGASSGSSGGTDGSVTATGDAGAPGVGTGGGTVPGNGNGSGNGKGNGNGKGSGDDDAGAGGSPGGSSGNGAGSPQNDAGAPEVDGSPGSGGSGAVGGGTSDAGCTQPPASGGSASEWQCSCDGETMICQPAPACAAGSHPGSCGACVPNDACDDDCVPPATGGCWVTGGGIIAEGSSTDTFGGNAMPMKSGTIRGEWENVDHVTGHLAHGEAQYLYCRQVNEPGPGQPSGPSHDNQVYFGGPARWFDGSAWNDGYWFDVMAEDHGEGKGANAGGPDHYHVTIRQISGVGVGGAVVFDAENDLSGGNIQIHPPNDGHPFSASTLPPWVALQP